MTVDMDVMRNALRKCSDNGWIQAEVRLRLLDMFSNYEPDTSDDEIANFLAYTMKQRELEKWVTEIIFDHEFAKALWPGGDDDRVAIFGETDWRKWPLPWEYHIQRLALAEDRMAYLRDNS